MELLLLELLKMKRAALVLASLFALLALETLERLVL